MNTLNSRLTVLVVTVSAAAARASADDARDPLILVEPADRPALREVVAGDEFDQRYAEAVAGIGDWSEWNQSQAPVLGMRITGVFPNAAVEGAVHVGDVFERVDDQLLWCDGLPKAREGSSRRLQYYSASDNAMRQMDVDSEKFGVNLGPYWQPEYVYLRGQHRNPDWDELALVAVLNRGADPDLAETALARAVAEGLPRDSWTAQVGAEIALMQNRPEVASDFAWFAERDLDPGSDAVNPLLLFRVALANYHLKEALRIVELKPEMFSDLHPAALQSLIELHASRPEAERTALPPTVRAQAMYRDDLVSKLRSSDEYTSSTWLPQLRRGENVKFDAETAHYQNWTCELREPVPNMDLAIRFSVKPEGSGVNEYLRWFVLKLFPLGTPAAAASDPLYRSEIVMLAVDEFQRVQFQFGNTYSQFGFGDPTMNGLTGQEYTARIVRVGGEAEVFLNGHRIYYGPVRDDVPSVLASFTATGSAVTLADVDWVELIERP